MSKRLVDNILKMKVGRKFDLAINERIRILDADNSAMGGIASLMEWGVMAAYIKSVQDMTENLGKINEIVQS